MAQEIITDERAVYVRYSPLAGIIWTIVGIVNALLGVRFLLMLFGANPTSGFVNAIYAITHPLVNPFLGIFASSPVGVGVVEWATIIALIAYGILASILTRLLSFGRTATY